MNGRGFFTWSNYKDTQRIFITDNTRNYWFIVEYKGCKQEEVLPGIL